MNGYIRDYKKYLNSQIVSYKKLCLAYEENLDDLEQREDLFFYRGTLSGLKTARRMFNEIFNNQDQIKWKLELKQKRSVKDEQI